MANGGTHSGAATKRVAPVKQADLRELLDLELKRKSLKAELDAIESDLDARNAELVYKIADRGAKVEGGELYAIVQTREGRANVAWAKVCERELGAEFCERERENAPRTESTRKVQVLVR